MVESPTGTGGGPIEVSILVSGSDPSLTRWVGSGLEGLPHCAIFRTELPPGESSSETSFSAEASEATTGATSGAAPDTTSGAAPSLPPDFDPDLALVEEESRPGFADRLRIFKERHPRCQILLLGQADSDLSPRALHPVAIRHWFFRPIDPAEVGRVIRAAGLSLQRQWRERHRHTLALGGFEHLVGEHPRWIEALKIAQKVAQSSDTSVLILGETGTGKGMLAKAIHSGSPRSEGPYVEINCGAIPVNLMETELFGHVRGAFTTAVRDKPGLLELADSGSAFLDEVGELEPSLQAKILKFLDDGRIRRVQGTDLIQVDVRMIAATNRNLEQEVENGRFRLDLFHRLNVVAIPLPPLRERPEDIVLLAHHYLEKSSQRLRGAPLEWSPEALEALCRYPWPGNVRELVNLTERLALVLQDGEKIELDDLPAEMIEHRPVYSTHKDTGRPIVELPEEGVALQDVERALVESALARTAGNVTEAARLLRMSRGSLRYRLEKMGLKERASRRRGRPMRRRRAA